MRNLIGREEIDLGLTLAESAQCFHWTEQGGAYGAVVFGMPVWVWQEGGAVYSDREDILALRRYLDLDRDYRAIADEYARYDRACAAVGRYPGLRILNQPTWEPLIAFILSANNNVPRIRALVRKLLEACGERYESNRGTLYAYPAPERLARCSEAELRALGMGYRDKYLIATARAVEGGFPLEGLRDMPYETAHEQLVTLAGVGDKVADCVQLFGCGHTEAFPVDVWIARVTKSVFGIESENRKKLGQSARALLGKNAGILQQFLFHAARTGALDA